MKVTILQAFFKKQSPKIMSYRNCKNNNKSCFQEQLLDRLDKICQSDINIDAFRKNLSFSIKLLSS